MALQTNPLKYKFKEMLDTLTVKQYERAMAELPKLVGKCKNTILSYAEIRVNEKREIPYKAGWIIEDYFALKPRGLYNVELKCPCIFDKKSADANQSLK